MLLEWFDGTRPILVQVNGFSVDVAMSTANYITFHYPFFIPNLVPLDYWFEVAVDPINPLKSMMIAEPVYIKVLIVKHNTNNLNIILQKRLPLLKGNVVYGQSFKLLEDIPSNKERVVSKIWLIYMVPAIFFFGRYFVVNINNNMEIKQLNLISLFFGNNRNVKD